MKLNRSFRSGKLVHDMRSPLILCTTLVLVLIALATSASAHAVTVGDAVSIAE